MRPCRGRQLDWSISKWLSRSWIIWRRHLSPIRSLNCHIYTRGVRWVQFSSMRVLRPLISPFPSFHLGTRHRTFLRARFKTPHNALGHRSSTPTSPQLNKAWTNSKASLILKCQLNIRLRNPRQSQYPPSLWIPLEAPLAPSCRIRETISIRIRLC